MSILRSFVAIRPMVIILCKSRFGCTKKKRQNEKFYQNALVKLCILMIENYQLTFFFGMLSTDQGWDLALYYYSCVFLSQNWMLQISAAASFVCMHSCTYALCTKKCTSSTHRDLEQYIQKNNRLRCLLCVKGLVICFYLG